jgi:hypothetical protein
MPIEDYATCHGGRLLHHGPGQKKGSIAGAVFPILTRHACSARCWMRPSGIFRLAPGDRRGGACSATAQHSSPPRSRRAGRFVGQHFSADQTLLSTWPVATYCFLLPARVRGPRPSLFPPHCVHVAMITIRNRDSLSRRVSSLTFRNPRPISEHCSRVWAISADRVAILLPQSLDI